MRIDGHVFCGISYCQFEPRLDGQRFSIGDGKVGILAGAPWPEVGLVKDDPDRGIIISRIAIFKPEGSAAVSDGEEEVSSDGLSDLS